MTTGGPHLLQRLSSGGVLLDLETGDLFSLNDTATRIWERRLSGLSVEAIAADLATAHGLPASLAARHVSSALRLVSGSSSVTTDPNGYAYERVATGYVFSRHGSPILLVDERSQSIRLQATSTQERDVIEALWAISPKLLALGGGGLVLHASAVVARGAVIAFAGESGAGKTTTAMALARAGAAPFCEDKLLIRTSARGPEAMAGLEGEIRRWVPEAAAPLLQGDAIDIVRWGDRPETAWIPLRQIGLVAATRRQGEGIARRQLTKADAASLLFCSSFHGTDDAQRWRSQLQAVAELSERADIVELTMPDGLASLDAAAPAFLRQV